MQTATVLPVFESEKEGRLMARSGRPIGSKNRSQRQWKCDPEMQRMIETNCISYKEIGDKFGLTRERIRQIAKRLGYIGWERKSACLIPSRIPFTNWGKYIPLLTQFGFFIEYSTTNGNSDIHKTRLYVNGNLCLFVAGYGIQMIEGREYRYIHSLRKSKCDFAVYTLDEENVLVVPRDALQKGTCMVWGRDYLHRMPNRSRMFQYLNGWHLLQPNVSVKRVV